MANLSNSLQSFGPCDYFIDPFSDSYLFHSSVDQQDLDNPSLTWKAVTDIASKTIEKLVQTVQKYLKITLKVVKSILKVVVFYDKDSKEKVGKMLSYLGLIGILKASFNVHSFYKSTLNFEKGIKHQEKEGMIRAFMDMLIKPCESLSNLLAFGESLKIHFEITWCDLFSAVVNPLSGIIFVFESTNSFANTWFVFIEYCQLTSLNSCSMVTVKRYLEMKVGATIEEKQEFYDETSVILPYDARKRNCLSTPQSDKIDKPASSHMLKKMKKELKRKLRALAAKKKYRLKTRTDKKIVNYMTNALKHLATCKKNTVSTNLILKDIRKLMLRKLVINAGDSVVTIAGLVTFVFASTIPVSISLPFLLAKSGYSIGKTLYQDHRIKRILSHPEFYGSGG